MLNVSAVIIPDVDVLRWAREKLADLRRKTNLRQVRRKLKTGWSELKYTNVFCFFLIVLYVCVRLGFGQTRPKQVLQ